MNRARESGRQPMQNRKSVSKKSASCVNDLLYRYRPLRGLNGYLLFMILGLTPQALCSHPLRGLEPFPGAVINDVSFVDCVFRAVRSTEVVEASGSILFRNVKIEPAEKGRSLNSRSTWP